MGDDEDIFKQFNQESDAFFDQLLDDVDAKPEDASAPAVKPAAAAAPAAQSGAPVAAAIKAASTVTAAGGPASAVAAPAAASPASPSGAAKAAAPPAAPKPASPVSATPKQAAAAASAPPVPKPAPAAATAAASTSTTKLAPKAPSEVQQQPPGGAAGTARESSDLMRYDLEGGASDEDPQARNPGYFEQDIRPPDVPPPPEDFSDEDLALREVLREFYLVHNSGNLVNVNSIVQKYRGCSASSLWAALSLRYEVPAVEAVDLLRRTLYHSAPFEYSDKDHMAKLIRAVDEIRGGHATLGKAEMIERAIKSGADDGSDAPLRFLCFRGVPDESGLRPQVWKVLLGYLPMARHSEWNAIQGEKRALYAGYKSDFLLLTDDGQVDVRDCGAETGEYRDLMQEIRNDVDRTRRDLEYFRRPETRNILLNLLFVYARFNPGVKYVQGMNEVAAVMLWVMSADPECAEADTFWCFTELMVEIKEGFMQVLDDTGIGVSGLVGRVNALLRAYDPELAKHLERSELPPLAFLVRWCTVLFAQDAMLPDVVQLWDTFIADPRRFEFVGYMSLSLMLDCRDRLLATDRQFELAEVLQSAPRGADFALLVRRANAICSYERREPNPPYPPRPKKEVIEDLSELAQSAAVVAQQAASKASDAFRENIAPVVRERAGQASAVAAVVAAEKAQALHNYWEETADARKEGLSQAGAGLSSLWNTVRTTGAAAASTGHRIATDTEVGEAAATRLSGFGGAATSLWARTAAAAAAFAEPPQQREQEQTRPAGDRAAQAKSGQAASHGYPS